MNLLESCEFQNFYGNSHWEIMFSKDIWLKIYINDYGRYIQNILHYFQKRF